MLPLLLTLIACTPELPATGDSGSVASDSAAGDSRDSATDTGPSTCLLYRDQDEDTWGDPGLTTSVCDTPGFVDRAGDCDDQNPSVNPDGEEVCNQADDDCDDVVDEGELDLATWYQDLDGDGYGTETATAESCSQPEGFAATGDDCQDADDTVHPYADELCDDLDQDCDGAVDEQPTDPTTWYADLDGDTYGDPASATDTCDPPPDHVADGSDCDDTAGTVHPGAAEHCDDVDEDCDTAIDEAPEDPSSWHADTDGDGYGDPANTVAACDAPEHHVADGTDCDDGDASLNPSASETCDEVDQDCDGHVDEGVLSTFYADNDSDGFGNPSEVVEACSAPSGSVADDQDCDDTDASVNPDASESCDEQDEDCDGSVDEDPTDPDTWYTDGDGDGHGLAGTGTEACSDPGGAASTDDDCDDGDAGISPSATETCDGVDQDCDGHTDEGVESTFYWDDDGDGYGGTDKTTTACSAPTGYVSDSSDCDDQNSDAYPGQTSWFDVDRGDGSFDYDCDGVETGEDETVASCSLKPSGTSDDSVCEGQDGWYVSPPACGDTWWWLTDCELDGDWATCNADTWDWETLRCR